ncbi:MAG: methyltransferase domain-containing protein [Opitutae bacterium]|nr:methyltransferase domain-containing protein [Opitutae bacterium]
MRTPDETFAAATTILDVGGWYAPEPRATHVIDLMPWETRGARLTLAPLPGERFTKATWFQADFLRPDFTLPFADRSFDLALCGHTIEDLAAPERLLRELQRVARRGRIECPARLAEQTVGLRDRQSSLAGHPHHHWIVDVGPGGLTLHAKADSALDHDATLVPLLFTERHVFHDRRLRESAFEWNGAFAHRVVHGAACRERAREFVAALNIPRHVREQDRLLRGVRRLRSRLRGRAAEDFSWWTEIVEASRPYSRLELR